MNANTPDEKPKEQVAKQVVAAKQKYFFPDHQVTIEASDTKEAEKKLKKHLAGEDGDAE